MQPTTTSTASCHMAIQLILNDITDHIAILDIILPNLKSESQNHYEKGISGSKNGGTVPYKWRYFLT